MTFVEPHTVTVMGCSDSLATPCLSMPLCVKAADGTAIAQRRYSYGFLRRWVTSAGSLLHMLCVVMFSDSEEWCLYSTVGNSGGRIFLVMPFLRARHVVAEMFDSSSGAVASPPAEVPLFRLEHSMDARTLVCPERSIEVEGAQGEAVTDVLSCSASKKESARPSGETREGVVHWLMLLLIGGIGMAYLLG